MDSLQARMGNAAHEEAAEVPHEARRYVSPHPVVEQKKSKKPRFPKWLMPVIAAVVAVLLLVGAAKLLWGGAADGIDHGKYQAVFLVSSSLPSNVYFGKLERISDGYYKLTDVYYLRTSTESTDANGNVTLTKMTTELHAPDDALILPREQVLYYQNMTDGSKVVQAIEQDSQKK